MKRVIVLALAASIALPLFSMLAAVVAGGEGSTTHSNAEMMIYPIIVGVVTAMICLNRQPMAASALVGAFTALLFAIGRLGVQGPYNVSGGLCNFMIRHIARSIIAFNMALLGGAVTVFVAAFARKVSPRNGQYRLAKIAAIVLAGLWVSFGITKLFEEDVQTKLQNMQPGINTPADSEDGREEDAQLLKTDDNAGESEQADDESMSIEEESGADD